MKWRNILLAVMLFSLACGAAQAATSVKFFKSAMMDSEFTLVGPLTDEAMAQMETQRSDVPKNKIIFKFEEASNADLAKLCAAYPEMKELRISSPAEDLDLQALAALGALKALVLERSGGKFKLETLPPLPSLEKLTISSISTGNSQQAGDLSFLKRLDGGKLLKLEVSAWHYANMESIGQLVNLTSLELSAANNAKNATPVDLAFLGSLPALQNLDLQMSAVANFDAVAACTRLKSVNLYETKGISSLAALKNLPDLESLDVSANAFPEAELSGFGEQVEISQR